MEQIDLTYISIDLLVGAFEVYSCIYIHVTDPSIDILVGRSRCRHAWSRSLFDGSIDRSNDQCVIRGIIIRIIMCTMVQQQIYLTDLSIDRSNDQCVIRGIVTRIIIYTMVKQQIYLTDLSIDRLNDQCVIRGIAIRIIMWTTAQQIYLTNLSIDRWLGGPSCHHACRFL